MDKEDEFLKRPLFLGNSLFFCPTILFLYYITVFLVTPEKYYNKI